jgi:hypothetical protein
MSEVLLRILILILFFIACSPSASKQQPKSKSLSKEALSKDSSKSMETNTSASLSNNSSDFSDSSDIQPPKKIDGSKLAVRDITIGKLLEGGSRSEVANFSTSGDAEYVVWQLCPEEETIQTQTTSCVATDTQVCSTGGGCVQNVTPYNKIVFPHLFAGQVIFSIKACVDPENAIDPTQACGPFLDYPYNSHVTNTLVTGLFAKRQNLINALNRLGEAKKQLYFYYRADLMDCLTFDAKNAGVYQAKIQFVEQLVNGVFFRMFTWGPKELFEEMNKTEAGKVVLGGVDVAWTGVKKVVSHITDSICDIGATTGVDTSCLTQLKDSNSTLTDQQQTDYCRNTTPSGGASSFCAMMAKLGHAMSGMAAAMSPAESIPVLIDALQTATDPENAVSRTCLAEQKLAKSSEQVDKDAVALTQQLIECGNQLRALGEL